MSRPMVKFFDVITQEEIIREMNDDEYEVHLQDLERVERQKATFAAAEAKRLAALSKLESLGLDLDDLKALGLG